ncbi:tripartite tricarboxylate transporter TctB family protein [Campylobacter coli]|nr:tripartite tricarboxylate transporter TctB family protein [Campylobacter coli]
MSSIRIVAGILLVISLIGIYIGWNIHSDFNYEPLGPRPFPVGTLILIALCFIFLVFFSEDTKVKWGDFILWKKLIVLTLAFLIYALFFKFLGFIICTIFLIFTITLLFGATLIKAIVFSISSSIILYYLFNTLLQITLPFGFIFDNF